MEYKVLYRKYRPSFFSDIVGQNDTVSMLKNAVIHNKISHAYLFTGPRGTGKTSAAKVFAKTINCQNIQNGEACGECESCLSFHENPDIIEIDAASNNGVDDVRELIDNIKIAPTSSKYKIYIIDEVHMMTQSAFNALLLTLEEPPAHAVFIMATTNVESVPITILSRCQRFNFQKISIQDLKKQIEMVCNKEKIEITEDAIMEIAYLSEGGLRDALSLLDQLSTQNKKITIDNILSNYGSISFKFIQDCIEAIEGNDSEKISNYITELQNSSADYKVFMKKMIQQLTDIAVLIKIGKYDGNLEYSQIKKIIFEFNECFNNININVNPFMLIELILLDSIKLNGNNFENDPIKPHKQSEKNMDIKESNEEINYFPGNNFEDYSNIKKIRVNNCFANASKEYLSKAKNLWDQLKNVNLPLEFASVILDSIVVAASNDYVIVTTKLESTSHLFNSKLQDVEATIYDNFAQSVRLISLTTEEWEVFKKQYVIDKKNGIIYEILPELNNEESDSYMNNDIFDSDKIEVV